MGLCKCPKRKVTNQFCFEHRVNVCEYCMVTNHPKCIVQSYLQWLQDSDCNPICTLCSETLKNVDCIRLTCYHVFHWRCLDVYARNLPSTTAPAGYVCPTCHSPIFPESNLISPVADVLKEKLASVNWARAGLGLPLLSSDREQTAGQSKGSGMAMETNKYHRSQTQTQPSSSSSLSSSSSSSSSSLLASNVLSTVATTRLTNTNNINSHSNLNNNNISNNQKPGPPYSIVNIESSSSVQSNKKIFEAYDDPKDISFDHDENKYQRKSAIEWFLRWWKLITTPSMRKHVNKNTPGSFFKKYFFIFIAGIIFFLFIIVLFSWLGRISNDSDPAFNDIVNQNINIQKEPAI